MAIGGLLGVSRAHATYPGLSVLRDLARYRGTQVLAPVVYTSALGLGSVSDVVPLVNATPLFTVVLIVLFLRGIERMTWRVGVASAVR